MGLWTARRCMLEPASRNWHICRLIVWRGESIFEMCKPYDCMTGAIVDKVTSIVVCRDGRRSCGCCVHRHEFHHTTMISFFDLYHTTTAQYFIEGNHFDSVVEATQTSLISEQALLRKPSLQLTKPCLLLLLLHHRRCLAQRAGLLRLHLLLLLLRQAIFPQDHFLQQDKAEYVSPLEHYCILVSCYVQRLS